MRAEQVGFSQRGQHGEKGFRTSDLFPKVFERVRQGMADRKTERPQPERIQKDAHLVAHANRAVLQVAVIKTQAWIKEDTLDTVTCSELYLARKKIAHRFNRVGG